MGKTGKAGNHGGRIRSDCLIRVEIKSSGGINLELESKVDALYGKSIRELVKKIFKHFEIDHADILVQDSGALEFVLAARIEAAIKQATGIQNEFLPPGLPKSSDSKGSSALKGSSDSKGSSALKGSSDSKDSFTSKGSSGVKTAMERERFRFTRLYLPGNNPSMMLNAGIHNPDGVILDLEDSVAPSVKAEARILVRNALHSVDFYGAEKMVRINQLPEGLKDLEAIASCWPELILIPKAEDPEEILKVEQEIKRLSGATGVFFMPILESALGIERAYEIASASKNVVAMAIGLEDYTADMGVQRTEEGSESLYARSRMVNACKAAGIQAIDSVYSDVGNEAGLRETVMNSRAMGFEGMGCIHPRQIPVIQEAFKPAPDEIELARAIVMAYEEAEKAGLGVVSLGSKMIDAPVVKRAQCTLNLALQMDLLNENWRKNNE